MTRVSPRAGYVQRDFDQLWVDFQELGRYFFSPRDSKLIQEDFDSSIVNGGTRTLCKKAAFLLP